MDNPTIEYNPIKDLETLFNSLCALDNSVYIGIILLIVAVYFSIRSILSTHGLLSFRGRAGRKEYIVKYIGTFIATMFSFVVASIFLYEKYYIYSAICLYIGLFFYTYNFSITIKRLHDLNISGWIVILQSVVEVLLDRFVNEWISWAAFAIFILFLACKKGTTGTNKYGSEPNLTDDEFNIMPCDESDTTAKILSIKGLLFMNGRRSRFPHFLVMVAVEIVSFYVEYIQKDSTLAVYSYIFALLFYISFCNTGKRLQDLNAPPLLCIAYFLAARFLRIDELIGTNIPISGSLEFIAYTILIFWPGTKGSNKYGPDPSDS